jgi:hypothetical protein
MPLTKKQLVIELGNIVDPAFASAIVESYADMQQRFFVGDWKPSELDGGRLCEAISRACYQLDSGTITHSQMPKEICEKLEDKKNQNQHNLDPKARRHISRAIMLAYKFRSDRGSVHISPTYTANEMDSMVILQVGKWIIAEFLRLSWNKDQKIIAETISEIIQLEYSLIHELDGVPLILEEKVSAPEEILLLLNHADSHRLNRDRLTELAKNNTPKSVGVAISRLLSTNEIRSTTVSGEVALTPKGEKRVIEKIVPKLKK